MTDEQLRDTDTNEAVTDDYQAVLEEGIIDSDSPQFRAFAAGVAMGMQTLHDVFAAIKSGEVSRPIGLDFLDRFEKSALALAKNGAH